MFKFNQILVPTDFSKCSESALLYAIDLARAFNSVIHVLNVVEPAVYPADLGFSQVSFVELEMELEKNSKAELEKIAHRIREERIEAVTATLFGRASDQIIEYSENNKIDAICIATHGRSGFEHLIFGSTTEKVLRKANCPVLSIRTPCK